MITLLLFASSMAFAACDYSAADVNNGWGWDPVLLASCPPQQTIVIEQPAELDSPLGQLLTGSLWKCVMQTQQIDTWIAAKRFPEISTYEFGTDGRLVVVQSGGGLITTEPTKNWSLNGFKLSIDKVPFDSVELQRTIGIDYLYLTTSGNRLKCERT